MTTRKHRRAGAAIKKTDAKLIALSQAFDTASDRVDSLGAKHAYEFDNPEIKQHYENLNKAVRDLGLQILSIPATTVEGLQVKARCARWCDSGLVEDDISGEFNDGTALASLVRDVLAMQLPPARSLSLTAPRSAAA